MFDHATECKIRDLVEKFFPREQQYNTSFYTTESLRAIGLEISKRTWEEAYINGYWKAKDQHENKVGTDLQAVEKK